MARRRYLSARQSASLRGQLAERLICTAKRNQMTGSWDDQTGDGHCVGGRDMRGPWLWWRDIKGGQWAGPWRRVHEDQV